MRRLQDGEGGAGVVGEDHLVGVAARSGGGAQVDDSLGSRHHAGHLAHIAKLDLGETNLVPWQRRRTAIGADDFVIVSDELLDHSLAELAAGASDQDAAAPHLLHRHVNELRRGGFMKVHEKTPLLSVRTPVNGALSKVNRFWF